MYNIKTNLGCQYSFFDKKKFLSMSKFVDQIYLLIHRVYFTILMSDIFYVTTDN